MLLNEEIARVGSRFNLNATIPTSYSGVQNNDTSFDMAMATHQPTTIWTGAVGDPNLAYRFFEWDGMEELRYCAFGPCADAGSGGNPVSPWNASFANQVDGSFGNAFHLGVSCGETLVVGTYDFGIFRHWPFQCTASGAEYAISGIDLLKFVIPPAAFGNTTTAPREGAAYYGGGPSGLVNQTSCSQGAPVFVSKPRFLDGDPVLRANVTGIPEPVRAQHDTWMGVEPVGVRGASAGRRVRPR